MPAANCSFFVPCRKWVTKGLLAGFPDTPFHGAAWPASRKYARSAMAFVFTAAAFSRLVHLVGAEQAGSGEEAGTR